jgi:hypothetical protein
VYSNYWERFRAFLLHLEMTDQILSLLETLKNATSQINRVNGNMVEKIKKNKMSFGGMLEYELIY